MVILVYTLDGLGGQTANWSVEVDPAGEHSAGAGGVYPLLRVDTQPGCEIVFMGIENGAYSDQSCGCYIE